MLQVNHEIVPKNPEIILDSRWTISLFKNSEIFSNVESCSKQLVMETNAGTKTIEKQVHIPGYGDVYYDGDVVANLFSLSELVKHRNRVFYGSGVEDYFIMSCKNSGKVM